MPIPTNEKSLLKLIARFQYLTDYKDKGIISLETYSNILLKSYDDEMERIKFYVERLEELHGVTSKFMDDIEAKCGEE